MPWSPASSSASVEDRYPLEVAFCPDCALVQILEEVPADKLFVENYLYFSAYSDVLIEHGRRHAAALIESRGLGPESLVVEIGSNDGTLLRHFVAAGIPVLGIDPAPDQAAAANAAGVPTIDAFFGSELAGRLRAEGRRCRRDHRQQRPRPRSRAQRRGGRYGHPARRGRAHHPGEPLGEAAGRRLRVRHHLPRAFLLLLVHLDRPADAPPRALSQPRRAASRSSTVERCAGAWTGTRTPRRPCSGTSPTRGRPGSTGSSTTPASPSGSRAWRVRCGR